MDKTALVAAGLWASFLLFSQSASPLVPKQRRKPSKVSPELDQKIKDVMATLTCSESAKYNKARAMVDPEFKARRSEAKSRYYTKRYQQDAEYREKEKQRIADKYRRQQLVIQ